VVAVAAAVGGWVTLVALVDWADLVDLVAVADREVVADFTDAGGDAEVAVDAVDGVVTVSSVVGTSGSSAPPLGTGRMFNVVVGSRTAILLSSVVERVHAPAARLTAIASAIEAVRPRRG
jgi:hypothetical protein